jgi:hypothetical protein
MYSWREIAIAFKILDEVTSWIVANRKLSRNGLVGSQSGTRQSSLQRSLVKEASVGAKTAPQS